MVDEWVINLDMLYILYKTVLAVLLIWWPEKNSMTIQKAMINIIILEFKFLT